MYRLVPAGSVAVTNERTPQVELSSEQVATDAVFWSVRTVSWVHQPPNPSDLLRRGTSGADANRAATTRRVRRGRRVEVR